MQSSPNTCTVATRRGPIRYQRRGEGPALVLIAGFGSTSRIWGDLPRLLSPRFTVLTPDNRGVGGTRDGEPFTLTGASDDVASVIAHAQVQSASLLGVSMGGVIATLTAARHPRIADRLVVASSAPRPTPYQQRILRFFDLLLTRLAPGEAAEVLMTFAFGASFTDRYPGFVDETAALWALDPEDVPGARSQLEHLRMGYDLVPILAEVASPTLVLAGELDPVVPASATRALADGIPGARFELVPGAAHSVLAEGGKETLATVSAFLSG